MKMLGISNYNNMFEWSNSGEELIFSRNLKEFYDKIICLDKIFERRFNFWYFYESFWLTKILRFQILSKNKEFEILFSEMFTLTHILTRDSFSFNTRNYGWSKFLRPASTSAIFHWRWSKFFQSRFLCMMLTKTIFCWYRLSFFLYDIG